MLLLDINLPDIGGIELCLKISKEFPDIGIIALTNYSETSFAKSMMRNGARGYLVKNTSKEELYKAIIMVNRGETYLSREIQNQILNENFGIKAHGFIPKLTRREKEVLNCIAEELTNAEIAEKLFISVKTVESHRNNLMQKFDSRNSAGLIKKAIVKGLIKV